MDKLSSLFDLKDGATLRPIEKASFADGNGVLQFTILEHTSPPRNPGDEPWVSYHLVQRVSHFGAEVETIVSLGSSSVVGWLIKALARTWPKARAADSDYTLDFYGHPMVIVEDGGPEQDPWANQLKGEDSMTEGKVAQRLAVAQRVASRYLSAVSWLKVGQWYMQTFSDQVLYFHAQGEQKNGGWSGVLVTVDLDRPRAAPKAKKSSVPKNYGSLWKDATDVPEKVQAAAKSKTELLTFGLPSLSCTTCHPPHEGSQRLGYTGIGGVAQ